MENENTNVENTNTATVDTNANPDKTTENKAVEEKKVEGNGLDIGTENKEVVVDNKVENKVENKDNKDDDKSNFVSMGNPAFDVPLSFISKHGFTADNLSVQKAFEGDFSFIKAELASKDAKGWEPMIALAEKAFKEEQDKETAKIAVTKDRIHTAVGDEATWNSIREWASKNADDSEKKIVNEALNGSPLQAEAMALWLKSNYEKATGTTVKPAKVFDGATQNTNASKSTGGALSPEEYKVEFSKLFAKHKSNTPNTKEYAELLQRKNAYRG